jgi:hypothetical protein
MKDNIKPISILILAIAFHVSLYIMSCTPTVEHEYYDGVDESLKMVDSVVITLPEKVIIDTSGRTIQSRFNTPEGYERVVVDEDHFGAFIREFPLKASHENVLYYDGSEKENYGYYVGVFKYDIGHRDRHQCADAVMTLRAMHLRSIAAFSKIHFTDVKQTGGVNFIKHVEKYNDQGLITESLFKSYLNSVWSACNTWSLDRFDTDPVDFKSMQVGDVLVVGGFPGHAVVVVDMAESDDDKVFMLAQSYMPAQETHILSNPYNEILTPWYSVKECMDRQAVRTPDWTFGLSQLKRFRD